ncbi:MAG TPA: hypothetical protein PK843_13310 [bacterium]|nr:hypothetical protein [bacterium]
MQEKNKILIGIGALMLFFLFCLALSHGVSVQLWAADDQTWLKAADEGIIRLWTRPSPFYHFRPIYGAFLVLHARLGLATPLGFVFSGILLAGITAILSYKIFSEWLQDNVFAFLAAVFLTFHPVRHPHYFWTSGHIDSLCLVLCLLSLFIGLKYVKSERRPGWYPAVLAVIAAAATWVKEIALILPLLLFFALKPCEPRKRLQVACASFIGILLALFIGWLVLHGAGRAGHLVRSASLARLWHYPDALLGFFGRFDLLMQARTSGNYLLVIVRLTLAILFCLLLSTVLYRQRRSRWAMPAFLLLTIGALIAIIDFDCRGLGLGCIGLALAFAGCCKTIFNRKTNLVLVILVPVLAFWSASWIHLEKIWRHAKLYSASVTNELATQRSLHGAEQCLVFVGLISDLRYDVWPVDVSVLDESVMQCAMLRNYRPGMKITVQKLANNLYRLQAAEGSCFYMPCRPMPEIGITEVECRAGRYVTSLVCKTESYSYEPFECDSPIFILWDGCEFRTLGK